MQSMLHSILGPSGPEMTDLSGRTALITGGAEGIGEEIARFFALMSAKKLVLVSRKKEHGDEAKQFISDACQKESKPVPDVEWVECDLGHLKQVKEVFTGIREKLDRLDLLILSSGINANQFALDHDGIERIFGVNCLGHYYAINLLYPLLRKTSKMPGVPKGGTRIVFESSEMHRFAPGSDDSKHRGRGAHFASEEEITEGGKELGPVELYGRTKLGMILYGKALRDKVIRPNGDDIYVISVHPGAVATKLQDQWEEAYPGIKGKLMTKLSYATGRSPEQGAYSALYAALSDEIVKNDWNGYYFSDPGKPGKETAQGQDANLATAIWELSERMVTSRLGQDAIAKWN